MVLGEEFGQSVCNSFKIWLERPTLKIDDALERLVNGTALHGARAELLREKLSMQLQYYKSVG
ncbi:hypothetical protein J4731_22510 [Providencia rettgeri]|nr:hypothetical protein [Providencia rettgeri]